MQMELVEQSVCGAPDVLTANEGSIDYCEEQLVTAARLGSLVAFQRLVECHETRVFRLALKIAQSHEDAEEIKQNAFLQAFKNMTRFRGDSRFSTWLGRITINEGLMKRRGRRVKEISLDGPVETEGGNLLRKLEDQRPNPEQCYSQDELQGILAKLIAHLSPAYRTVVQLHYLEGFSTDETAGALEVSPTAVKSRLRRARLQMRKLLNQYFNPVAGRKTNSKPADHRPRRDSSGHPAPSWK